MCAEEVPIEVLGVGASAESPSCFSAEPRQSSGLSVESTAIIEPLAGRTGLSIHLL